MMWTMIGRVVAAVMVLATIWLAIMVIRQPLPSDGPFVFVKLTIMAVQCALFNAAVWWAIPRAHRDERDRKIVRLFE